MDAKMDNDQSVWENRHGTLLIHAIAKDMLQFILISHRKLIAKIKEETVISNDRFQHGT